MRVLVFHCCFDLQFPSDLPCWASFFFKLFYFWLHWVFITACGLSLVAVIRLLIAVASVFAEHGFWGAQAVAVAQGFICLGACGVSLGRGQTGVPCSTRWICSQGDPRAHFHKFICHPFLLGFPSTIGNYFSLTFGLPFYFFLFIFFCPSIFT